MPVLRTIRSRSDHLHVCQSRLCCQKSRIHHQDHMCSSSFRIGKVRPRTTNNMPRLRQCRLHIITRYGNSGRSSLRRQCRQSKATRRLTLLPDGRQPLQDRPTAPRVLTLRHTTAPPPRRTDPAPHSPTLTTPHPVLKVAYHPSPPPPRIMNILSASASSQSQPVPVVLASAIAVSWIHHQYSSSKSPTVRPEL